MLFVKSIGSHNHIRSQALCKVRHCLIDVFLIVAALPGWFAERFQLISRLKLCLGFIVLFQHDVLDVIVPRIQV